jgi:CSLREA domain-containing protein
MANFTVTRFDDVTDANDGQLTLREAIDLANAQPDADRITFAGGTPVTIQLTQGQLAIGQDLVIDGGRHM